MVLGAYAAAIPPKQTFGSAGANHTHLPELLFLPIVAAIFLGVVAFNVTDHGPALPYVGLFVTSLIAGTMLPFLPGSSEMAMAGLLATGVGAPALLIAIAIVGNVWRDGKLPSRMEHGAILWPSLVFDFTSYTAEND